MSGKAKGMAALAAFAGFAAELRFAIANDHTNLIYRAGEEATFTVTAMRDGKPLSAGTVDVKLDNFGPCVQLNSRVDLAAGNPKGAQACARGIPNRAAHPGARMDAAPATRIGRWRSGAKSPPPGATCQRGERRTRSRTHRK